MQTNNQFNWDFESGNTSEACLVKYMQTTSCIFVTKSFLHLTDELNIVNANTYL